MNDIGSSKNYIQKHYKTFAPKVMKCLLLYSPNDDQAGANSIFNSSLFLMNFVNEILGDECIDINTQFLERNASVLTSSLQ